MPAPRDTSPEIWKRQLDPCRAMGPDGRLRRALELFELLKDRARDGIRRAHPDWPESGVEAELGGRLFDRAGSRSSTG